MSYFQMCALDKRNISQSDATLTVDRILLVKQVISLHPRIRSPQLACMTSTCLSQNLTIQQGQATNSPTYFLFPIESPGLLNWRNSLCNQHTTAYKHLSMPSWINSLGKAMNTKCICDGIVFSPVETYFNKLVHSIQTAAPGGSKEFKFTGHFTSCVSDRGSFGVECNWSH